MLRFWLKVFVYIMAFIASLFGLSALDFNRFLKQGKPAAAQVLYILLSIAFAYLVGNFLMDIIFYLSI